MKIENERYVLYQKFNDEVLYLTKEYGFDNDIREALKAKNIVTARFIKSNLETKHKCYLNIMPLKITYE